MYRPVQEEWNTDESIDWRETRVFMHFAWTLGAKERKKKKEKENVQLESNVIPTRE